MKTTPLGPLFGVSIEGVDARTADPAAIRKLAVENSLVVLRDQTLTPHEFAAFSARFGPLEYHVLDRFLMDDPREVYVISNIVENGKPLGNDREGFGWHTDLSYFAEPTAFTLLYGVETPSEGADTLFADTYAALDALPPERRAAIDRLNAIHSYRTLHQFRGGKPPLTPEQLARTPDVAQPLVRTHPDTGRKSLYLGGQCIAGVEGMSTDDGKRLVAELFAFATSGRFTQPHKWRPRDLVLWDNRGLLHSASEYDRARHRRLIWRTSARGERPF
jgi:taurine dioxygenase